MENFDSIYKTMRSASDYQSDENQHIEYFPGGKKARLVICAPHGGQSTIESVPDRDKNPKRHVMGIKQKLAILGDRYTKEIAILLRHEMSKIVPEDYEPHLIICNVKRIKLDVNRDLNEGTLGEQEVLKPYNDYHAYIETAKNLICTGLLVDIHGQTHEEGWVELGYLICNKDMNNDVLQPESCSIKALASRTEISMETLIRGHFSLGCYLQSEGVDTIPSPANLKPGNKKCYTGQHTTQVHGSRASGSVDAIQIEIPKWRRNYENAAFFSKSLANALAKFLKNTYKFSFT